MPSFLSALPEQPTNNQCSSSNRHSSNQGSTRHLKVGFAGCGNTADLAIVSCSNGRQAVIQRYPATEYHGMLQLRIAQSCPFLPHTVTPYHITRFRKDYSITRRLSLRPVRSDLPKLMYLQLVSPLSLPSHKFGGLFRKVRCMPLQSVIASSDTTKGCSADLAISLGSYGVLSDWC